MDLIAIYVQDHLALSLGGLRLARRTQNENRGTPLATYLASIIPELEADRAVLKEVASALGGGRSLLKETALAAGELVGRLKPNGRLLGYSPLSRVWELEALVAGSEARAAAWRALDMARAREPRLSGFSFGPLEERARRHAADLDRHRLRAAEVAFTPDHGQPLGARAGV
ncbi:MAG: hypothetical protein QM767_29110 [Anaeromyxobacter sp.]